MSVAQATPPSTRPFSAILRDFSAALVQQMFYWGMDAAHSGGNIFQKRGFCKSPSSGLKGTSCYSLPWEGGEIFLTGSCVGWFPKGVSGGGGSSFGREAGVLSGREMSCLCPASGPWILLLRSAFLMISKPSRPFSRGCLSMRKPFEAKWAEYTARPVTANTDPCPRVAHGWHLPIPRHGCVCLWKILPARRLRSDFTPAPMPLLGWQTHDSFCLSLNFWKK